MREELAEIVHPVFTYGLTLKDELNRKVQLDFSQVQQDLIRLLKSENAVRRITDYVRSGAALDVSMIGGASMAGADIHRGGGPLFLGARYALVCWLDEIMGDTPWGEKWKDQKLETQLYNGSNNRAWLFWEQAKLSEGRSIDALEVFFLCVTLGFRGDWGERRDRLEEWYNTTQATSIKNQPQLWGGKELTEGEPVTDAHPLTGRESLQRMLMVGAVVFLILIPAMVIAAVLGLR